MKFYQSKTVWLGVVTMLIAFAPLIADYVKVISPNSALIVGASATLLVGLLNIVLRVWFTDSPIEH